MLNSGLKADPEEAQIALFVLLLCASIIISHLFEKKRWLNDSITALIIGLFSGIFILLTTQGKSSHVLVFSERLFFIYLLPPIIFNAGFRMKKKQFFHNFLTIILFGAVGSVISFFIISLGSLYLFEKFGVGGIDMRSYFALGAIFTATDSVCTLQILNQDETPLLHSLVFGEGVINDATSVVLFNAFQRFDLSHISSTNAIQLFGNFSSLFLQSTLLGLGVGLLSGYIIKKLYSDRHSTNHEVALMILMAYLSYIIAEVWLLSGILSVFFCGIVMSHYTWYNVTECSKQTSSHIFATLSSVSEIFIFLYVGMDSLDIEKWKIVRASPGTSVGVSLILLGLVLVGRAAFVFPLSFISNLTKKYDTEKIGLKQQIVIWWAGLMRGAVSMALAYNQFTSTGKNQLQGNSIMITSTITIVLFTNLVCGLLTKNIIRYMIPKHKQREATMPADFSTLKSLSDPLLLNDDELDYGIDGPEMPHSTSLCLNLPISTRSIRYYWRRFDGRFMRPVFGGGGLPLQPSVPSSPLRELSLDGWV